jgi:hypothetical protein
VRVSRRAICGLTLVSTLCAAVFLAAPAQSARSSATPHALQLLINGKQLPITPFTGPDHYNPITASKLSVVAKWKTNLQGTGLKVVISTTEPNVRTWRTCSTGTSCSVPGQVPILNGEQMSWIVRIMEIKHHYVKVLSGFMVCLARHAHPA